MHPFRWSTCFYSFNLKGFCVEKLAERKPELKDPKSICYEFEVSEFDYGRIRQKIEVMLSNRQLFHYNRLGLIFCFLHIPLKRTRHYFCSQFVAELPNAELNGQIYLVASFARRIENSRTRVELSKVASEMGRKYCHLVQSYSLHFMRKCKAGSATL